MQIVIFFLLIEQRCQHFSNIKCYIAWFWVQKIHFGPGFTINLNFKEILNFKASFFVFFTLCI